MKAVYAALGLRFHEDGSEIVNVGTSFHKPLDQMGDKRLRQLLQLLEVPIMTILQAFHDDTDGLLRLLAGKADARSPQAQKRILASSLAEMPLVKDVVNELNSTEDREQQRQLLSFLSQQFSHKELNHDLGLAQNVSRRRYALTVVSSVCMLPCME